jgi:hypothetical protein
MKLLKYNNELLANIVPVELLLVVSISVIVLILILPELSDNEEVVRFVRPEPSPICFPYILPDDRVEKKPKFVDIEAVDICLAVRRPVLRRVVLRTGGTIDIPPLPPVIPVRPDPSPTNLPYTVPAEIVEKNPKFVDIVVAEILTATKFPVITKIVLIDAAITSPIFIKPLSLPIVRLSTVRDEI